MPLKDVVVYLANRKVSGTLTLEQGATVKQAVIERGTVINASSNVAREYLGQFLINLGHINEEQFQRAYETQQETRVFLGRILLMIGLVSEENLRAALSLKFRETLLDAFEWQDGTFAFEADVVPAMPEGIPADLALVELHKEADFRAQAWQHFRRAFPHRTCTMALKRDNLEDPPRPGSVDEKVLQFIEAGMTLEEIGLRLHATEYFLYNRLYALYRLGALEVQSPDEHDLDIDIDLGLGDSPSTDQLLEHGRAFFDKGNFRDAWVLARRAHESAPNPAAAGLLKQVEAAWLPQLRVDLVAPKLTPRVLEDTDVKGLTLTAPERYLMSRIDGKRSIEHIIRVAPLREFEALAHLERFILEGWVTLS
jgi:hypothetical protein